MTGRTCSGCGVQSGGDATFCGGCARPLSRGAPAADAGGAGVPPAGDKTEEERAKEEHRMVAAYYLIALLICGMLAVVLHFWLVNRPREMSSAELAVHRSNMAARNGERAKAAAAEATARPDGVPGDGGGRVVSDVGGGFQAGGGPGSSGGVALPLTLTRQDIMSVVLLGAASARKCASGVGSGAVGRSVRVRAIIAGTGAVEEAQATGPEAGTPVGACLEDQVRRLRFPQFSGEPVRIELPFGV